MVKKVKILLMGTIFLISGILIGQVVQADSEPAAGSQEDPLVTASYVEEMLQEVTGVEDREFTGDTVILATGEVPYDAQASAPLVSRHNAVLLLTPSGSLSAAADQSLRSLQPSKIYIAGGTAAISGEVEEQVKNICADAEVQRVFGENRYETAAEIAKEATGKNW